MLAAIIWVGFSVIHYSSSADQDALQLSNLFLNNTDLGSLKQNQHQHPGYYETIAQKTEGIARAMAEAYIAESRKKHEEYMAAYEKYKNDHQKYNDILTKRDAVKVIQMNNWTKL